MAKTMKEVQEYLVSAACLICVVHTKNGGQCSGKINSQMCLVYKEIRKGG